MIKFPQIPGCELFLVGGSVRDYLLDKTPKDLDFVVITDLSFTELVETIDKLPNSKVFLTKPEFLTIRCKIDDQVVDLAFPRTDGEYEDGRRPETTEQIPQWKETIDILKVDSMRRDFTMNAMYLGDDNGIRDFHGGLNDLKAKIIRTVGDPNKRFQEDFLRILRAVRFSAQLDFDIPNDVKAGMMSLTFGLKSISSERIREELNLSFKYDAKRTYYWIYWLDLYDILKQKNLTFQLTEKKL